MAFSASHADHRAVEGSSKRGALAEEIGAGAEGDTLGHLVARSAMKHLLAVALTPLPWS
jgi:hypothetical protein